MPEPDVIPIGPEGIPQITVRPQRPTQEVPFGEAGEPFGVTVPETEQPQFGPPPAPLPDPEAVPEVPEEPIREEDLHDDPFLRAAQRVKKSNVGKPPQPEQDWARTAKIFGESFTHSLQTAPQEMLKSWYESTGQRYIPPNVVFIGDDGQFYDKDNNLIPSQYKPAVLPVTRDPVTGDIQLAMPGLLDVWNTIGSPAKGVATLGAGLVRKGAPHVPPPIPHEPLPPIGHNQGPPLQPPATVPPPPSVAPPPIGPPPVSTGRKIIHGHDEFAPTTWDDVYTQTIDNLHPLKVLQDKVSQYGKLSPDEMFYELARLTRGSYGRTHQALMNSTYDFNTLANNGKGLKQVLNPVKNELGEFEKYAVAMRDVELWGRGINPGENLQVAQQIVANAPKKYQDALKELWAYQNRVLGYLKDSGLISDKDMKAITVANRHYVPFHRLMGAPEYGTSTKNIKTWDPIKGIKGSQRDILSPIETIIRNTHQFIDLAEKNRVLNALVDAADQRGLTGLVSKVPRDMHPVNVTRGEVEKFFNDNGIPVPPAMYGGPDKFAIFRPNVLRPANDEISVWKNGKQTLYKVDPEVANAVNGMGRQEVDFLLNMMSLPARTLRAGAVLAPEFLARNPMRDQLTAAVFSEHGYLPFVDWFRGIGHMMANTQKYQNWLKSGGANSALVNIDRKYMNEQIRNMFETGWWDKLKNNSNPLTLLGKVAEYGEQPTRISEFIRAQKRGKNIHQSGLAAREVSVDFGRYGASKFMQAYAHSTAFANPQIQGVDRAARAFKDNFWGTSFKIGAYITMPSLAMYAYNRQDPRMKDIPRQERDTYWHFPTDDWKTVTKDEYDSTPGGWKRETKAASARGVQYQDAKYEVNMGQIYRVPKPFELGVLFGSSFERGLDAYFKKDPEAFKGFAKNVASSLLPSFLPNVAAPMVEQVANYNFFRDTPLVPKRLASPENRKYEYTPFTTETAKFVGSLLASVAPESSLASPIVIENYVRAWSGTLGMYTLQGLDKLGEIGGEISGKPARIKPEWSPADYPLLKAFASRMPSTAATSIRDFYDHLENTNGTSALIKRIAKSPAFETDADRDKAINEITSDQIAIKLARTGVAISQQFKAIEEIQHNRKMTPPEKRRAIDMLTLGMMYMAEEANKAYYEAKKLKGQ